MARLRRADCSGPGITRKRAGQRLRVLRRGRRAGRRAARCSSAIRELGIPPAWKDVWICPYPNGHLQATGIDAAGRKQYRYHDAWRTRRDAEKFEDMTRFARALPRLRERVEADLAASDELTRERVLACAVRLLDRGFFRIGTEEYTVNESFGLATIRKEHVTIEPTGTMVFDYPAKSGQRRVQARRRPAGDRHRLRAQAPPRRRRRAARLQGRPRLVRPALRRHQRLPQAGHRRRLLGQGLPDLERDRARRASRSPSPARRTAPRRRASARSPARSRRPRTTSATRRRCAARPTSTRASSTPTAAASCSTSECSRRRSRRAGRRCRRTTRGSSRPCSTCSTSASRARRGEDSRA